MSYSNSLAEYYMRFPESTSPELAKEYCFSFIFDVIEEVPDGEEGIVTDVEFFSDGTCQAKACIDLDGYWTPEDEGSVIENLTSLLCALSSYNRGLLCSKDLEEDRTQSFDTVVKEYCELLEDWNERKQGGLHVKEKAKVILNKLPGRDMLNEPSESSP